MNITPPLQPRYLELVTYILSTPLDIFSRYDVLRTARASAPMMWLAGTKESWNALSSGERSYTDE